MAKRMRGPIVVALIAGGALVGAGAAAGQSASVAKPSKCNVSPPGGFGTSPTELSVPLDPVVLSRFGVFRRPAGPSDALPPLNPFGTPLGFELRSYYPSYIRQVAQLATGRRFFVVPGFRRALPIPPAHCLPRALRRRRKQLVQQQQRLAAQPAYCLGTVGRQSSPFGDVNCLGFDAIDRGARILEYALSRSSVGDLVPDGVATVRLTYRNGNVVSAAVSDNFFTFTPPQGPVKRALRRSHHIEQLLNKNYDNRRKVSALLKRLVGVIGRAAPSKIDWLDATGQVVRSLNPRGATGFVFGPVSTVTTG